MIKEPTDHRLLHHDVFVSHYFLSGVLCAIVVKYAL